MPSPGCSIFITETLFGVPKVDFVHTPRYARAEYYEIFSSSDASVPTRFRWDNPITVKTDTEYAFVIKFDFGADFRLWKNVQGQYLVGTTNISPGSSGTNAGAYFEFASGLMDPTTANENWRPLSDTSLKFTLYGCRYAVDGEYVADVTLDANVELITPRPTGTYVDYVDGRFIIPSSKMEFLPMTKQLLLEKYSLGVKKFTKTPFFIQGAK